jgi:hypothetical protein
MDDRQTGRWGREADFAGVIPPWKSHGFRFADYTPEICRSWRAFPLAYSYRNATIGSTFVARRAGI